MLTINVATAPTLPGIVMCVGSTKERWRHIIKLSLIGWTHTQNDSCVQDAFMFISYLQLDLQLYHKTAFLYRNGLHLCVAAWFIIPCVLSL